MPSFESKLTFRKMRTSDLRSISQMHGRASPDTLYYRYLHPYKPTVCDMRDLARVRGEQGAVYVAVLEEPLGQVVGIACYKTDPHNRTVGQTAFLVEDAYQNRGIGRTLVARVIEDAFLNGIHVLEASIHPSNQRMLHLFEKSGYPYHATFSSGSIEAQILLYDRGPQ